MICFTLTPAGQTLINNATAGSNPVLVDSIVLYNNSSIITTIQDFIGNVVRDDSGIGDYLVIDFDDRSISEYTITSFKLKSGSTDLAISDEVSVVKAENKQLKMRLTAQFDGAYKCAFNCTSVGLPYATKFRQGVIRFADATDDPSGLLPERAKQWQYTVFSASDTLAKIQEYIHSVDQYVPWDTDSSDQSILGSVHLDHIYLADNYETPTSTSLIYINGKTNNVNNISIDGYITGTAVSSVPTITSGAITDTSVLVNGSYIASLYSNAVDTSQTETADSTKLVTSHAVRNYVETKLDGTNNNYVHKSGAEAITGQKTFSANIATSGSALITGSAVQSQYNNGQSPATVIWNNTENYSKLPTVEVVNNALTDLNQTITTAYESADNVLQSQIDGINAGQNLADIVDSKNDLSLLPAANLNTGDKVQVLHDKSKSDGTIDPDANGISTVYSLTHGTAPTGTRDISSTKTGYYWHYVGEYGVDAYTKSESDDKYVAKSLLDQVSNITSTASTTNAPSTKGVYDYIETLKQTIDLYYVKLNSQTNQSITSPLTVTGNTSINGISLNLVSTTYSIQSNRSSDNNFQLVGMPSQASFNLINQSSDVVYGITFDASQDSASLKRGSSSVINITPITSGSSITGYDVTGDAIADYNDTIPALSNVTDGRLVTVDYMKSYTGSLDEYAKLSVANTFTALNTFSAGISSVSYSGTGIYSTYSSSTWSTATTQLPTVSSVKSAINDAKEDTLNTISSADVVGSIGLFIYTEYDTSIGIGVEKGYGLEVNGLYLKPVGISLPMSGQISYKAISSPSMSGRWRLLNVALKRTATEPCLVFAQKISDTF